MQLLGSGDLAVVLFAKRLELGEVERVGIAAGVTDVDRDPVL